ncbi:GGDEF domain-containing protein [Hydrogenimonas thermophila]|nr:GGDEF domain-containing protein [Hydrogenimonas thermophila]WOE70746.1 GGDEF domain-containing protein [Hydrogenimonas thermophila]WOE73263.1 GGDEF domain-containing protein [Hydrogenimonas thermophila]
MLDEHESDIYLLNKTDELLKKFFEDLISLSSFDMILRNLFDYIKNDIKSLNKISVYKVDDIQEYEYYVVDSNQVLYRPEKQTNCKKEPLLIKVLEKDGCSIGKLNFYFDEIGEKELKLLNIFLNKIIVPFSLSFEKDINLKKLKDKSIKDPLTNLYNRNYMNDILSNKIQESIQNDFPLSIAMIDIDFFKKINDTYGHVYGDCVLKEVSMLIQNNIRETDIAIRYGGEEILIIMPFTNIQGIYLKMEKIREIIEKHSFCDEHNIKITVSIGVYQYKDEDIERLIDCVDKRLYEAKNSGRNRVVVN